MAKVKGLIAEIGNHHFGDVSKAKELIKAAYEHGAHFVKMQMIEASEVVKYGSMPLEFYQQSQFTLEQYQECYDYAESLGAELFFSYFGEKLPQIGRLRKWSAAQTRHLLQDMNHNQSFFDNVNNVLSLPLSYIDQAVDLSNNNCSSFMVASQYMQNTSEISEEFNLMIKKYLSKDIQNIGYSDHTLGIKMAKACAINNVQLIEKHFNIYGVQKWNGVPYRDCFHAANCQELETLAKTMRGIS